MQIRPSQVASETRIDDNDPLVQALKKAGAKAPKFVLVFDSNQGEADEQQHPWKVRVFYNSPAPAETTDLDVPVMLMNSKIKPAGDAVVQMTYPGGYRSWCGEINGQLVWIP